MLLEKLRFPAGRLKLIWADAGYSVLPPIGIPFRALDFSVVDNTFVSMRPEADSRDWSAASGYCS